MTDAELRRRLADVKLRSTLKDSQLTPDLLKKRQYARRMKRPVVEGSTQTYADMARERKAAEELQFGPQQRSMQAQAPRDAGWYDAYLQSVREAQARQQAQAAQVAGQIQQFGQAGLAASQQAQGQLEAQMAPMAAAGGATVDPSIANIANQASLVRQAMVNSFGANASANALAQGDLLRARESAGGLAKLEHQGDLSKQLQNLLRERGAFGTDFEAKFKDNAQKTVLENQAFGLDVAKEEFDQQNTLADNARADESLALSKAKDSYQRKNKLGPYRVPTAKGEKPKTQAQLNAIAFENKYGVKPATTQQHTSAKNAVGTARSFVKELKGAGWKRGQIAAELLKGIPAADGNRGYPKQQELWLSVALDQAFLGRISKGTAKRLHEAGYSVRQLGL